MVTGEMKGSFFLVKNERVFVAGNIRGLSLRPHDLLRKPMAFVLSQAQARPKVKKWQNKKIMDLSWVHYCG